MKWKNILALPRIGECPDHAYFFCGFDKAFTGQPKVTTASIKCSDDAPPPRQRKEKKKKKNICNFPKKVAITPQAVNISQKYVELRAF